MRFTKKMLAIMLTVVLVLGFFSGIKAEASETGIPKISIKYLNGGADVKIIIGKTAGADAYDVILSGRGDSYTDYWSEYYNNLGRRVTTIWKNGKAKRTYTLKGLPEGTYTIRVNTLYKAQYPEGTYYYKGALYATGEHAEEIVKIQMPKMAETEEKTYDFSNVEVGDVIIFGSYEQDDIMTNGKEDIEWIVLSKSNSQMLVLSKYALDCLPYNLEREYMTWKDCSLRKWLNKIFYKTAFTKAERSLIKKTKLKNADNPQKGTEGGKATWDKIFLLSLDDVINSEYGFSSNLEDDDVARRCAPTAYAVVNGALTTESYKTESWVNSGLTAEGEYTCQWFLRTPGHPAYNVLSVAYNGTSNFEGSYVHAINYSIRPALWISLE